MACCGSGPLRASITCSHKVYQLRDNVSEYFFFDRIHPTEKANYQFAKLMWDGSCHGVIFRSRINLCGSLVPY